MSQYIATIPEDGQVREEIRDYFEEFYKISDNSETHEKYAEQFTKDGKLIMGPTEINGRDDIIKLRHSMWEKVAKRSHAPTKIYAFGKGSDDVMLYGGVDYVLKDGKKTSTEWAARAHFVKEDGKLKMDLYQVFLDTGAVARAK